ncbi:hypothetical protein RF55_14297 [Lasius niger]|uniref:Uncharacterized protein n=1 Tax=Lasius niger TaxID=67767 RepID=A0A0J7K8K1_LASNI|nr:hypothetical protein RF55_14297 [Lasius niger]
MGRTSTPMENSLEEKDDDQSEASMEFEEDSDRNEQESESVTVARERNKELTENSQKNGEKSDKQDSREVYWNREGILKNISEIDTTRLEVKRNERYEKDHGGPFKVIITLTREKSETKRAVVIFANYQDANVCLDSMEQLGSESDYSVRTEARSFTYKGVITDWPDTVMELWEVITDHSEIIKIEKINAERILAGRETELVQMYDRYEEPEKWPKVKPIRQKIGKDTQMDKRERYEDQRKWGTTTLIRENTEDGRRWEKGTTQIKNRQEQEKMVNREERMRDNYFAQFNVREEEINKEHQGVTLRRTLRRWSSIGNIEEEGKAKNMVERTEIEDMKKFWEIFSYYLENDNKFRNKVFTKLGGISRREIEIEDNYNVKEEARRRGEYREQEGRRRARETVIQIKQKYWKKYEEETDRKKNFPLSNKNNGVENITIEL